MTPERALHELLGLDGPEALTRVAHVEPAEAAAEGASLQTLAALLAQALLWTPVAPAHPEVQVFGTRAAPTYVALPTADVIEVVAGAPVTDDDMVGFDTGAERVVLRVAGHDGRTWVVDAKDGRVDLHVLVADALAGLDAGVEIPPDVTAPDVAAWAASGGVEPWLAEAATRLAAGPSPVERAAAAGVIARLWDAETPIAPADHPRERVRAWLAAQPEGAVAALETRAVERAWSLAERIAELADLPEDARDAEVAALVRERDDLQSVRRVLRLGGAGIRLAEALQRLDRLAAEHMSALADHLPALADDPDADRWRAVAWQEPDAWWTGLA